jgi:hypothetical protein
MTSEILKFVTRPQASPQRERRIQELIPVPCSITVFSKQAQETNEETSSFVHRHSVKIPKCEILYHRITARRYSANAQYNNIHKFRTVQISFRFDFPSQTLLVFTMQVLCQLNLYKSR